MREALGMADQATQSIRQRSMLHLMGGYVLGRVAQRIITQRLDPGSPTGGSILGGGATRTDDAIVIGGGGFAAYQAIRGKGKWRSAWAGAAIGLGTPLLDRAVDAITDRVAGMIGGGG